MHSHGCVENAGGMCEGEGVGVGVSVCFSECEPGRKFSFAFSSGTSARTMLHPTHDARSFAFACVIVSPLHLLMYELTHPARGCRAYVAALGSQVRSLRHQGAVR